MALQTLGGKARHAMENMETATLGKLESLDAIFSAQLNISQRCDPRPKAYDEFLRTRMRTDETAVDFLNRLLSLSVVIGSNKDPTVSRISNAEQTPDISPWGSAGTAMDIEHNSSNEQTRQAAKRPQRTGRIRAVKDSKSFKEEAVKTQRASKHFKDQEERDQK
eukprot:scaffold346_cov347-Pavlova_lutheri.AAC.27